MSEATQILRARLNNLQSAALLVIVGEVKAGKSSFLNALVGEEVCRVAPEPCTVQHSGIGLRRRSAAWPARAIPGSAFICRRKSARAYARRYAGHEFDHARSPDDHGKLHSAERSRRLRRLRHQSAHRHRLGNADRDSQGVASQNGLRPPAGRPRQRARADHQSRAREAIRPRTRTCRIPPSSPSPPSANWKASPDSGFAEFREFLRYGIECGEVWRTKVEGSYQTIRTVMAKLLTHLRAEKAAIAEERAFYQGLLQKVEARQENAPTRSSTPSSASSPPPTIASRATPRMSSRRVSASAKSSGARIPFAGENGKRSLAERTENPLPGITRREIAREAPRVSQNLLAEMQALTDELRRNIIRRQARIRQSVDPAANRRPPRDARAIEGQTGRPARGRDQPASCTTPSGEAADIRNFTIAGSGLAAHRILIGRALRRQFLDRPRWRGLRRRSASVLVVTGIILAAHRSAARVPAKTRRLAQGIPRSTRSAHRPDFRRPFLRSAARL